MAKAKKSTSSGGAQKSRDKSAPAEKLKEGSGAKEKSPHSLIIVESRAKASTLQKFLGDGYVVIPSYGHVRDLPTRSIGVNVSQKFEPTYLIPRGKKKALRDIKEQAKESKTVYMATDPDREGEAIAWHLIHAADIDRAKVQRITFHEITSTAIRKALTQPHEIDMNLVDAQQARRILDRLVGFKLSPLLSRRISGAGGAGRVQSVALRFVVEREKEIRQFVPIEWWTVEGIFSDASARGKKFYSVLEGMDQKLEIPTEKNANSLISDINGASHVVGGLRERRQRQRAQPPFTTASLQRSASSDLGMSPTLTMRIAQQLYEGISVGEGDAVGLITYMRTDSTNISPEAQSSAGEFIKERYGADYVPANPNVYRTRTRNAQEAHEAVRPTSIYRVPNDIREDLDPQQYRLYNLIWRRYVASQMTPAQTRTVTVVTEITRDGEVLPYRFRASATEELFPGHRVVSRTGKEEPANVVEARDIILGLVKGQPLHLDDLTAEQHFTEPPPRFSEASLIRLLEEEGIGRPSTYAPTVRRLVAHRYCELERRQLVPTELGEYVTNALVEHFPGIVDRSFTQQLENDLDKVASGEEGWIELLGGFWGPFSESLQQAETNMERVQSSEPTGENCPNQDCDGELVIRTGRNGRFIGCTEYPECTYTRTFLKIVGGKCPGKCQDDLRNGLIMESDVGDIVERRSRKGRTFFGCSRYPECTYVSWARPRSRADSEKTTIDVDGGQTQE